MWHVSRRSLAFCAFLLLLLLFHQYSSTQRVAKWIDVFTLCVSFVRCALYKLTIIFNEHANFISEAKQTKLATMCYVLCAISYVQCLKYFATFHREVKMNRQLIPPKMFDARKCSRDKIAKTVRKYERWKLNRFNQNKRARTLSNSAHIFKSH